jgi:hypothetical protein
MTGQGTRQSRVSVASELGIVHNVLVSQGAASTGPSTGQSPEADLPSTEWGITPGSLRGIAAQCPFDIAGLPNERNVQTMIRPLT